jgi:hypothetical protein
MGGSGGESPRAPTGRDFPGLLEAVGAIPLQCPFLHHDEEDWNQNQNMDCRGNHASHDWGGNWFHYIGANARLPQDRNQAG